MDWTMDFTQLKTFRLVAATGSFTQAAAPSTKPSPASPTISTPSRATWASNGSSVCPEVRMVFRPAHWTDLRRLVADGVLDLALYVAASGAFRPFPLLGWKAGVRLAFGERLALLPSLGASCVAGAILFAALAPGRAAGSGP
jgi:hypothetical protein